MRKILYLILTLGLINSCNDNKKQIFNESTTIQQDSFIPVIEYSIVKKIPHDTSSFTEGLCFHNNELFESTGSPDNLPQSKSIFGNFDFNTGKINIKVELDKRKYFGEGIVFFNDRIYQLTYKNQIGFIYDAKTYKLLQQFSYQNKEGWGLTSDGCYIIMSDGTNVLTYFSANDMKVFKTLKVTNGGCKEDLLNELEYINGYIYANVWTKNYIVKIDPNNGHVVGLLQMFSLVAEAKSKNPNSDVINGIAYDSISNKIYVTGKLWPNVYQIEFLH